MASSFGSKGGSVDFTDINQGLFGLDTSGTQTQSGGQGNVSRLSPVIDEMLKSITPEGAADLIQTIYRIGFEQNAPQLLSFANAGGGRPGASTTTQLMVNDLVARLAGQANLALGQNQANAAQAAAEFANLQRGPTTTTTNQSQSGILDSVGKIFGL